MLEVEHVTIKIEKQQLRWFGHLIRMCSERPLTRIRKAKISHKRRGGRPSKGWNDEIAIVLKGGTYPRKRQEIKKSGQDLCMNNKVLKHLTPSGINKHLDCRSSRPSVIWHNNCKHTVLIMCLKSFHNY